MDPDVRQRDCVLVASRCASRQIRDMHYEARVACVRNWYAEKRKIRMTKAKAREIFMEPWQYLQVVLFSYYRLVDRQMCFH